MMLLVLLAISIFTFALSHLVPTDVARLIAGPRASPESIEKIKIEYGLNLPIWHQYLIYLDHLSKMDLGVSFASRRPVIKDIQEYFPATAELTSFALFFSVVGGIIIGTISAIKPGNLFDRISSFFAITGVSLPGFWLGLLAQLFFYQYLGLLPMGGRLSDSMLPPPYITGFLTIDSVLTGNFYTFIDALKHLFLPATIIGLEPFAVLLRIVRSSMIEVLRQPYILTAKAKGLTRYYIIWRHALKNTFLPIATLTGLMIGYLMGGSILVESVFAWPGVGRYSANAMLSADYNAVMGVTIVMAIIYLVANFIVDVLCRWVDPRI